MTIRIAKSIAAMSLAVALLLPATAAADVYELRTYTTNEGKLDELHTRFRDHTLKLFEKHGMVNVGYWVPTDEARSANTLIYVLKHKSREAAAESWKGFLADPDWKKAFQESRVNGPLLAKRPDSVFMAATDYTPEASDKQPKDEGLYELRIYRTNEGKLKNLDARFRDHTIEIFARHGIQSIAYWHPTDEPDSKDTLIYIVRHKNRDAAAASWKAFSADEEWKKVAKESQVDGRFLRERPESIYLKPTDYSALK